MPFNPFAANSKESCKNGYTKDDLAQFAYALYGRLLGGTAWDGLSEEEQAGWRRVAKSAINVMDYDGDAEINVSVRDTAKKFYHEYSAMFQADTYESISCRHTAWQAIVRHLANLIDSDGKQNVADFETRAYEWARQRMSPQLVS